MEMRKAGRLDILSILCVLVGGYLLLENFGLFKGYAGFGWPLTVTLAGIALFIGGWGRGRYGQGAVGIGTFLILSSILFLYLNLTSWSLMKEMWTLFIGFLGVSIIASGFRTKQNRLFFYLGIILILLSLTFYLIFGIDPKLWPISLVLLGVSLFLLGRKKDEETDCDY